MPVCPSCDQPLTEPSAPFCGWCGAAVATEPVVVATGPVAAAPSSGWRYNPDSPSNQGLPVAVALGALTLAVLLAIALSGGSGSRSQRLGARAGIAAAATPARSAAAAGTADAADASGSALRVATREHGPALLGRPATPLPTRHYNGGGYTLAYPVGWTVAASNRQIANYAETQIESRDAAAKVTIDHTPSEITDPAFKAAQVEAATSRTSGYRRLVFRPVMIGGRSGFEWVFTLTGANDPQRTDIFVNTGHDGFAFLAHGTDFTRAVRAARAIAASVAAKG